MMTRPMTADEFFERAYEFEHAELIDGEVVEMPLPRMPHGLTEANIVEALGPYVRGVGGLLACGDVGYATAEHTVRGADVVVHLQRPELVAGWMRVPPDIVVEVISPSDTWRDVMRKLDDWLAFGVREVWIAEPERRTVQVRRPDGTITEFAGEAELTSPLLPGFTVPLPRLFD
jgi:Uma2 family endonuclease